MGFEEFSRRAAAATRDPVVGIQKRGTFSLNAGAVEALRNLAGMSGEEENVRVKLLFDRDRQLIAFKPTDDVINAYEVRKQQNSESYLLAGRAFTQHYEIDTSVSRRYAAVVQDALLVIDLNDPAGEGGLGRPKH